MSRLPVYVKHEPVSKRRGSSLNKPFFFSVPYIPILKPGNIKTTKQPGLISYPIKRPVVTPILCNYNFKKRIGSG